MNQSELKKYAKDIAWLPTRELEILRHKYIVAYHTNNDDEEARQKAEIIAKEIYKRIIMPQEE